MSQREAWQAIKARRPDTAERRAAYERARLAHELGAEVRRLREERGVSEAELARRMGSTLSAILRLELGGVDPQFGILTRVSVALDADLVVGFRPHPLTATGG